MKIPNMMVTILLAVLLLTLTILAACNGDDGNGTVPPTTPVTTLPSPTKTIPPKPIKIIIGNHTDVTGVSSNAMELLTIALEDTAEYYTENNLIPGVEFEVITYDGQYDPSRDIPGYEWLKERGADFIFSPVGATAVTLKPFLEEDKMILFMMAPHIDAFVPPGWVFAPGNALFAEQMYTLLIWVAENDPDFPQDRPAKIGGAFWNESTGLAMLGGAEEYALRIASAAIERSWDVHAAFDAGPQMDTLKDDFARLGVTYHPLALPDEARGRFANELKRFVRMAKLLVALRPDPRDECLGTELRGRLGTGALGAGRGPPAPQTGGGARADGRPALLALDTGGGSDGAHGARGRRAVARARAPHRDRPGARVRGEWLRGGGLRRADRRDAAA